MDDAVSQRGDRGDTGYSAVTANEGSPKPKKMNPKALHEEVARISPQLVNSAFAKKNLLQIDVDVETENDGSKTCQITIDNEEENRILVENRQKGEYLNASIINSADKGKIDTLDIIIKLQGSGGWGEDLFKFSERCKSSCLCGKERRVEHFLLEGGKQLFLGEIRTKEGIGGGVKLCSPQGDCLYNVKSATTGDLLFGELYFGGRDLKHLVERNQLDTQIQLKSLAFTSPNNKSEYYITMVYKPNPSHLSFKILFPKSLDENPSHKLLIFSSVLYLKNVLWLK